MYVTVKNVTAYNVVRATRLANLMQNDRFGGDRTLPENARIVTLAFFFTARRYASATGPDLAGGRPGGPP